MDLKFYVRSLKESIFFKNVKSDYLNLKGLFKNGGYKIILFAVLLTFIFAGPLGVLLRFISSIFLGGINFLGFSNLFSSFNSLESIFSYLESGALMGMVYGLVGYIVLYLLSIVVVKFFIVNANFKCFKKFYIDEENISFGKYFKSMFSGISKFAIKLLLNVSIPIIIISTIGSIISYIPFLKGDLLSNIIPQFLTYGLLFRFTAMMLKLDYDSLTVKLFYNWFSYALISYIVTSIVGIGLLSLIFESVFILYSIVCLDKTVGIKKEVVVNEEEIIL